MPQLTEATMEGKHTLSFLLDGEVWVSERGLWDLTCSISLSTKQFRVSGRRQGEFGDNFTLDLTLQEFAPKSYSTETADIGIIFTGGLNENYCSSRFEEIDSDPYNEVEITWIDNESNYIAGTFNLRLLNRSENCLDTIYITDGRFDLQFQPTP